MKSTLASRAGSTVVCWLALAFPLWGTAAEFDFSPGPAGYELGPDSLVQDGVPKGSLIGPLEFHSQIIENTVRRYWVYVPAGYRRDVEANLLVFQDGQRATNPKGSLRVPQVLENLIHQKAIPTTIGLFLTPGNRSESYPEDLGMRNPNNRAREYDATSDRYARFLIDEMIPELKQEYTITDDPKRRVIGGTSSGAICAFTVAWHRPDQFANVMSFIGSYVSIGYRPARDGAPMIAGGDLYPTWIRREAPKGIRVFIQDGTNDLDNLFGNWYLANQRMVAAFEYANRTADRRNRPGPRYDVAHIWTDGRHSDAHGGALLPDVLRWIWRDHQTE